MSKIKILHLNHLGGKTGSARLMETIMSGLPSAEFESHALVGYNFGSELRTKSVFQTASGWFYRNLRYKGAVGLNFYLDIMTPGCIDMDYLRGYSPYIDADIVHLHCIQGGYFDWTILPQLSQEKKIIMTLHDDWLVSGNDPKNLFHPYKTKSQYLKRREIFQKCKIEYIGVSDWITQKVKNDEIIGDNTIRTIYNGIDKSIFFPHDYRESRERLGLPLDKKIVISIAGSGGKSNAKGLWYVNQIVRKYKNNPDFVFVTLGNFSYRKVSENLIEVGYVSSNLVAEYFSAADIFLYPTIMDSFGLVVAESLACGCPVVTFDTGGVGEVVQHGLNGYVARHKDIDDLVVGFDYWVSKKSKVDNLYLGNIFSKEAMIEKYVEIYMGGV